MFIVPVRILDSQDLWNPHGYLPNDEFDTIVKFGRPISLESIREEYGTDGSKESLSAAARGLRRAVLSLGESYIDET